MITYKSKRTIVLSGQRFDAIPFTCIANNGTGEILFEGHLAIDSQGTPYVLKVEPRMTQKERTRVIDAFNQERQKGRTYGT